MEGAGELVRLQRVPTLPGDAHCGNRPRCSTPLEGQAEDACMLQAHREAELGQ